MLKIYTQTELNEIIRLHGLWLSGDKKGIRANLSGSDLSGSNLSGSDLSGSNLSGSDLSWSNLSGSNLSGSNLSGSDLSWSNLSGSNLSGSDLSRSNLSRSNLSGSNLSGSDLSRAKNIPEIVYTITNILPDGELIGWKKCKNNVVVKLQIPAESKRSNATTRKCRTEFVDVLEVIGSDVGISVHNHKTEYRVGQRVKCDNWCEDRYQKCAGGIHFFLNKWEAENYNF